VKSYIIFATKVECPPMIRQMNLEWVQIMKRGYSVFLLCCFSANFTR